MPIEYRKDEGHSISGTDLSQRLTYSITEAAAKLGVGRNQAYEAAHRGDIPTIRIGRRFLVPKAALDKMLSGDAAK